ncbi:MAG: hypothetical protein KJO54_03350 [Gammaproteobacteria bacterium]|nr:hypothetical protein [Gammaproteobacteria bacterium]NNM19713.1 hypothetical protein [Gammaproteobacteria bacterium]
MPHKVAEYSRNSASCRSDELHTLIRRLEVISAAARQVEHDFADELASVDPQFRASAANLLHYSALRQFDLRTLQGRLAALGLSSLGRAERHVMASLKAVQEVLKSLASGSDHAFDPAPGGFAASSRLLDSHAADILGPKRPGRNARIMVTLPGEAASDPGFVDQLIHSGMDVARINCAHDNADTWAAMIANIRQACEENAASCTILMDLAGAKLRTGSLAPGPRVLHVQPGLDARGRVISPKRFRLVANGHAGGKGITIPVSEVRALRARPGDSFRFRDCRGKKRKLKVIGGGGETLRVECYKPIFIETGTRLKLFRRGKGMDREITVGELPPVEQPILLRTGDWLILHRGTRPGQPALVNKKGIVSKPAHISCTLPEVFRCVRAGEPVYLNDGKIGGIVESVTCDQMVIRITQARKRGSRLRGGKSINFPGSSLRIGGLTDKDRQDLRFVACHADAVGLSFVREPEDVDALLAALEGYGAHPGIVLKIETEQGFHNLVRLLLTAMRTYPVGIMIARGDLAIECGWERLAELQEEILWLSEAAQVPVVWATQVLEGKTRKGLPSRAEISDAAMSQRADCVMLNKGPHIIEAIEMLDNILRRMQAHHDKKTATLRKLSVADVSG